MSSDLSRMVFIPVALLIAMPALSASVYVAGLSGFGAPLLSNTGEFSAAVANDVAGNGISWSGAAVADGLHGLGGSLAVTAGSPATPCDYCVEARATLNGYDYIRILPTAAAPAGTPVDVQFDLMLDGSIVGYGGWFLNATLNLAGQGPGASFLDSTGGLVRTVDWQVHEVVPITKTMNVGFTYELDTYLDLRAYVRYSAASLNMDFIDTAAVRAAVLTPNLGPQQLLGDSGRDYLLAPVPLPASGWLLATAFTALSGFLARRKFSA